MFLFTRREWLATAASSCISANASANSAAKLPLGFSLYGMKSLAIADSLKVCRDCGYDGVELALMPGYHADPAKLSAADTKELRKRLTDSGLSVLGLMENLPALGDDATHKANLDRLKAATELANVLVPDSPPPIETVLGGKLAEWDKVKEKLAARLTDWAAVAKAGKTVLAVKPHVSNALHTPEGAIWLLKQVNSDFIRLAFDYSHFELRGVKLADAVSELVPHAVFVHVKDAKGTAEKFEFVLPGEGTTNYPEYAKLLSKSKYNGPVVVEVSGMVSAKAGYDPAAAARACFRSLSASFGRSAKE
ncbi:MAG: sugar phosphate isomerase/epimerase [Planctomycetes bacterium]|nr:sugar phosphate isomerase/epimerase [Planctomycetota bacterium]